MVLSISEIAGIINVAIVFLQFTFPLLLVVILAGIVPAQSNAITWSVAGRFLNGSWWPTLLRSDAASTSRVSSRVIFISTFTTGALILLAAAAVTTPLGLYTTITSAEPRSIQFVHAQDLSPLGQATPDRNSYNTSRMCGWLNWISCPGQFHGFYATTNSTGTYLNWDSDDSYISSVVPENLTEIFSSGRSATFSTVAGPFDIEYRSYKLVNSFPKQQSVLLNSSEISPDPKIDNYSQRTVGTEQYAEMLIMADDFVIRDGIVADMRKGGLGFRNHTIPADTTVGAAWNEGLLWVEPETVCVPNNITIELRTSPDDDSFSDKTYLVDDGGIVNAIKQYPVIDLNQTQLIPELYARAHKGAVLVNYNLRQELGVSTRNESHVGKRFLLTDAYALKPGTTVTGTFDAGLPGIGSLNTDPQANLSLVDSIGLVTSGSGGADTANFSRIANEGGLVIGAMTNIENGEMNGRFDPGSNWSAPVYACSTSLRAFVMDVEFFINGTSSLDNVKVRSATPRKYASNATTPLWAVENTGQMNVSDVQPIWGLVDNSYEFDSRLWTLRRDYIYLPAGSGMINLGMLVNSDSLGSAGPIETLSILYDIAGTGQFPDYSGEMNLPLKLKWQGLSQSTNGIAEMMALLWTDMTANYLTSARSQINTGFATALTSTPRAAQDSPHSISVTAEIYQSTVRYKIPYAILAIIFLVAYLIVLVLALAMCVTRRSTMHSLNSLLNQTSVGRAVVAERYRRNGQEAIIRSKGTKDWVRDHGDENIGIFKERKRKHNWYKPNDGPGQAYEPMVDAETQSKG